MSSLAPLEPLPDNVRLSPIRTSLDVMQLMTPEQENRVSVLIHDFKAGYTTLLRDSMYSGSVIFALYTREGGDIILTGLIEPDGRAHT